MQKQWIFEETKLDDEHFVSVAMNTGSMQVKIEIFKKMLKKVNIGVRHVKFLIMFRVLSNAII